MSQKVEEILAFCKENGVRMIDFKTVDLRGRWHHITIPVERFSEETLQHGIGFDGSNFGYASWKRAIWSLFLTRPPPIWTPSPPFRPCP